jgi:hypothetical protein
MSSSNWKRALPFGIVGSVICVMLLWSAASTFNEARVAAKMSAQLALVKEAENLLEAYRAEHGHYPKSLDSLTFSFPDGGDSSTLALLKYESDSEKYSIVTKIDISGEEYRVSR